jgi:hypothetical protein
MSFVLLVGLLFSNEGELTLKAGFAAADITPEAGAEMPGGFGKNLAKGTRDKLWAAAAVISDGANHVALVGIDALFTPGAAAAAARARIEKATPIPGRNLLVSASHTHTGGPVVSCFGSEADPAYVDRVARGIAAAVEEAWKRLQPVEIGIGTGREETISFNRRFLMRDGREITHPGKPGTEHNGDIVRPAGPIDPDVGVLAARAPGGAVAGVVVNFTCHSTVIGGDLFSADYVGRMRKHLQARYGEAVAVVFLQGACGDITQVDNQSPAREFGAEHAELMGRKLAAEVERTIGRMSWEKAMTTAAGAESVPIAIRAAPDPEAERPAFGLGSGQDDLYASERGKVAEERARTPVIACEVMAVRLGPLGIAANGAEYFCEYALRIKECSPQAITWFAGYANEYIGYVPTPQAFAGGGYEPRTARSSKLAPDAGQKLAEAALRALNRVREN